MRLRVINLGLPKSGTTTLGRALRRSGLKCADHSIRPKQTQNTDLHDVPVAELMYRGYFETGDPLAFMEEFDAFSEINLLRSDRSLWPQTDWGLLAAIIDHHPGVRFVASRREARDHALSILRWSDMGTQRLPRNDVPGLPAGFGETPEHKVRWIEGHHAFLAQVFNGRDDFLQYDLDDPNAPAKIGQHIGRDLPWWGKANVNRSSAMPSNDVRVA